MAGATPLPILTLAGDAALYHIGTLDRSRKGGRGESLEGHGVSVSVTPHAWMEIARLGGEPLWAICPAHGAPEVALVDLHAAERDGCLRDAVEWALAEHLCERRTLWRAWRYDSEWEAWTSVLCASRDEAQDEALLYGGLDEPQGPDGTPGVVAIEALVGLDAMERLTGRSRLGVEDVTHYAAMLWLERTVPAVDGVWWPEAFAPEQLSAPRGALFPGRMERFEIRPVEWSAVDDDPGCESLQLRLEPATPLTKGPTP